MRKFENQKQALQRLDILKQQLTLTVLYPDDFLKKLGKRGTEELINDILDEMNEINKYLKNES